MIRVGITGNKGFVGYHLYQTLSLFKEEFNLKVKNLIFIFTKIKNSKYFTIISQLLTKLDYHLQISE